jgi:hypothetical protein
MRPGATFKVHPILAACIIAAGFGLQGWMLNEISGLKERVAGLTAKIEMHINDSKHLASK